MSLQVVGLLACWLVGEGKGSGDLPERRSFRVTSSSVRALHAVTSTTLYYTLG